MNRKRKPYKKKWTPKIGQRDKCILGSSRQLGGILVINTVRGSPVKRLMPSFRVVERKIQEKKRTLRTDSLPEFRLCGGELVLKQESSG